MDNQTFVPALLALKNSSPETVIKHFHELFAKIGKLDVEEVTAAYQTVRITMQSSRLERDPALRLVLSALHQRMVGLTLKEDKERINTANFFCTLLQIKVDMVTTAADRLCSHQIA